MTENMPAHVKRWIEEYREACAAVNGEEWTSRLSATYNNGWIKLELAAKDPTWGGPEWYKNVHLRELAQMTKALQQQAAYAKGQTVTDAEPEDLPPGPLEMTIVGNGDPEVFAAREVEILVSGRTYMIEPGEWGGLLIRTPGVVLPYHLGATCVERSAIRVNVYVTAADEAKARAAQEKTGD